MAASLVARLPDVGVRHAPTDASTPLRPLGTGEVCAGPSAGETSAKQNLVPAQAAASEDRDRKVTLLYGQKSLVFGWKPDLPGRAFGDQLRDAVRYVTGLATLEGVELHAATNGSTDAGLHHVTPRDIFEGRVQVAHIHLRAGSATSDPSSELPVGLPASSVSSRQPVAATRSGYAPRPTGTATAPTRSRNAYALGPAANSAMPERSLPVPSVEPAPDPTGKVEGRFQKKGGSQLEFMRMMAGNKNPVPKLPEGVQLTAEEVAKHRKPGDAWTIFQGRVYDITSYLDFHPGGKGQIMKGAGKDCTELYNQSHPWVNCDGLIGKLCLGKLVVAPPKTVEEEPNEEANGDS